MDVTNQRSAEKLTIKYAERSGNNLSICLANMGPNELKLGAIYLKNNGVTTFASAPAAIIQPDSTQTVSIIAPSDLSTDYSITASTSLGTLSKEYSITDNTDNSLVYDVDNIVLGSLRLRFTSFEYSKYVNNQWSSWTTAWKPPVGEYISWRIEVINISNETIILDKYTSFTASDCNGPSEGNWYVVNSPITLPVNSPVSLLFRVGTPGQQGNNVNEFVKIESGGSLRMIFLTFFGSSGGKSFGETIPFLSIYPGGT